MPDLRGRVVMGRNPCGKRTDYASKMGATGGHAKYILTTDELPDKIKDGSSSFLLHPYQTLDYIIFIGDYKSKWQIYCCFHLRL